MTHPLNHKLSHAQAFDLYKGQKVDIKTFQGTPLTSGAHGFDVATWTLTFNQDFDDVNSAVKDLNDTSSIPDPAVNGRFWAKGSYAVMGINNTQSKAFVPGTAPEGSLYFQAAPSVLGLGTGNFSGSSGNMCSNIESMRQKVGFDLHDGDDGTTIISEGFQQKYGYWTTSLKAPPWFRPDTIISWSGTWLYNNRWDLPDAPTLEIDYPEVYIGSGNNVTKPDTHAHISWHYHDTVQSILRPGELSRDYAAGGFLTQLAPNPIWGFDAGFNLGDAFHTWEALITPEWFIVGLDGLEISRIPMYDHYHQPLNMLISHFASVVQPGTKSVSNGDFASLTAAWTLGSGWTIPAIAVGQTSSFANAAAVANGVTISQPILMVVGIPYNYTYTISGYVAGGVRIKLTGGTEVLGTTRTANGTYTETLTSVTGNNGIAIEAIGTTTLKIDNVIGVNGYIENLMVTLLCDYCKVYQNPDWNHLTIGGSTNAWTFTSGVSVASYVAADGRCYNVVFPAANTVTNPTLNMNSFGARTIKKYSDNQNQPPWSGSLISLANGDIISGGTHNVKWSNADNCWILLNPERSLANLNTRYKAPAYSVPAATLDPEIPEGIIAAQWSTVASNKIALLPDDHSGKVPLFDPTATVQPRCVPNRSYITVATAVPGHLVGSCPISGTPSKPARAAWSGSANFDVNPANGDIYVKTGASLVEGIETGEVSFWSEGVPSKKGANVCTVSIEVKPDVPFDIAAFFGANLAMLYEFDKSSTMTITGGKIEAITDGSGQGFNGSQATDANRVPWSATGFNSAFPAAVSTGSTDKIALTADVFQPLNAMTQFVFYNDGAAAIAPNAVVRKSDPYDYTQYHTAYFEWNPVGVSCLVNGASVNVDPVAGSITTFGWIVMVGKVDTPSGTLGTLYSQNDIAGMLFQSTSSANQLNGVIGLLCGGKAANTTIGRDKLIAHLHWRFGIQSLLPSDHPYKSVAPTLYG